MCTACAHAQYVCICTGLSTPEWLEKGINEAIVARFPFVWWLINLAWAVIFIFLMLRVMRHLADYSTGNTHVCDVWGYVDMHTCMYVEKISER